MCAMTVYRCKRSLTRPHSNLFDFACTILPALTSSAYLASPHPASVVKFLGGLDDDADDPAVLIKYFSWVPRVKRL